MKKHLKVVAGFLISAMYLVSNVSSAYASLPYYPIEFPRDHAGHQSNVPYEYPNDYRSEWWNFSGLIENLTGDSYYYSVSINQHLSLFADGSGPLMPFYLGNIVITDLENEVSKTKQVYFPQEFTYVSDTELDLEYEIPNQSNPFESEVFILNRDSNTGVFHLKGRTTVDNELLKVNLYLLPTIDEDDALMLNETGLLEMPEFPWVDASMYDYDYPEMYTAGIFSFGGENYVVNPIASRSWMNHQWGDYTPTMYYSWEWLSFNLDNGLVGNVYLNTQNPGYGLVSGYAAFILPDGTRVYEEIDSDFDWTRYDYWMAPNNSSYPLGHVFNFESVDLSIDIHSNVEEQFVHGLVTDYWNGFGDVVADYEGDTIDGHASKVIWLSDYWMFD